MDKSLYQYMEYIKQLCQEGPHFGNQFLEDPTLQEYLQFYNNKSILNETITELQEFGQKCCNSYQQYGHDQERNQPQLYKFAPSGERIDFVDTTDGWKKAHIIAAEEKIISRSYNPSQTAKRNKENHRLVQISKLYLYMPTTGLYGCPLSMTDGCIKVLKNVLSQNDTKILTDFVKKKIQNSINHMMSNDSRSGKNSIQFKTSGQWMTEKRGGSNVNYSTETIAVPFYLKNGQLAYQLYGCKFFCSAIDATYALALARIIEDLNELEKLQQNQYQRLRTLPISLFFIKYRSKKNGQLKPGFEILRLKDKLGTRQLPTAEVIINGGTGYLISNQGIETVMQLVLISRLYNSVYAVATMRRFNTLCRDFAHRRIVRGKLLSENPLQTKVLTEMEITFRGNLAFLLKMAQMQGEVEIAQYYQEQNQLTNEQIQTNQLLLRLLTPILKLFTAKEAMKLSSEGIEFFGGYGYIESSFLPVLLRDAQTLPIWEGTTNVQCYDFVYILNKDQFALNKLLQFMRGIIFDTIISEGKFISTKEAKDAYSILVKSFNDLSYDLHQLKVNKIFYKEQEANLREIAFGLAKIFIASLLLEIWICNGQMNDELIFLNWVIQYSRNINSQLYYKRSLVLTQEQNSIIAYNLDENGLCNQKGDFDLNGNPRPKF